MTKNKAPIAQPVERLSGDTKGMTDRIYQAVIAERERIADKCAASGYPDGHDIAWEIRNDWKDN